MPRIFSKISATFGLACVLAACGSTPSSVDAPPLKPADIALTVLKDGVAEQNPAVINRYVHPDYIQHSALLADGRKGLLAFIKDGPKLSYQPHRVLSDGDRAALHGTYTFPDGRRMVAFDVFRVRDGRLIEHWDALQAEVPQSKSLNGNSMVDGPTEVIERDKTETNRAIAIAMLDTVFIKGQFDRITDFVSTAMYRQHNPHAGNGLAGLNALVESLARQNLGFGYTRSPLIIADGNFVLAGSEGYFGPLDTKPYGVFYDLWRFENGKVVEHWDVVPTPAPDPANLPHRNGLF